MGWEDFTKLIYYSCFVLINCFDNHPDACIDLVQTYGANHEGHGEGRGPGCFDFRVSDWGRGGGQAKLGVSVSPVHDGVGVKMTLDLEPKEQSFHSSTDS